MDIAPPPGPTTAALDGMLLEAKLSVPQVRPHSVTRAGLIGTARASECRVVGVIAPAGYGKSTLLAEWALTEDRPVAWASLDRYDDDPATLLALLASAYGRVSADRADLVADMIGVGVSLLGRAAPRLASAFRSSPEPFVLFLDDLHYLQSPDCHDVLEVVLSGIPRGSQFVAASRTEQRHLPRLRASGDALELLAGDLALDAAAAEQIFSQANVQLTPEMAAEVTRRTEGWPVGLYLAAAIARDSGEPAVGISGDDRYVADYLAREALMRLPKETQRFLRRTAVLDQVSGPLCDAVVGDPQAHEQLRLVASSSFLTPLDRRREWYRYHALFQEFLLSELRGVEPEVIPKLHLRAADWYEANGSPSIALEHLLNTDEQERCVALVTALILPTFHAGHLSTVQRWLSTLGASAIERCPPLAVLAAWVAIAVGDAAEVQRLVSIIDTASYDLVPLDGTASFDSGRAMLRSAMLPGGPALAMRDATLAMEQEPPWSPWRDTALLMYGNAYLFVGTLDRAGALFAECSAAAAALSNTEIFIIAEVELASLAMDAGRWPEATEHIGRALAALDEARMHEYAACLFIYPCAARLALHDGDLKEAQRQHTRGMRGRLLSTIALPFHAVRLRLALAKVSWAMGEHTTAHHLLREVDDLLFQRSDLGVIVDDVAEFRRMITVNPHAGVTGAPPLTPAELRLLPYLQTHLTIREIADRLFVSWNTVRSEVSSIYRKLGVSSRGDAVQQATMVGLLGFGSAIGVS